eukprot:755042-Hanusia_phi.AAC.3
MEDRHGDVSGDDVGSYRVSRGARTPGEVSTYPPCRSLRTEECTFSPRAELFRPPCECLKQVMTSKRSAISNVLKLLSSEGEFINVCEVDSGICTPMPEEVMKIQLKEAAVADFSEGLVVDVVNAQEIVAMGPDEAPKNLLEKKDKVDASKPASGR